MSYKETSAYFIPDQCLFGAYPTQNQIHELEEWGCNLLVDLTMPNEKRVRPYKTKVQVIKFVIPDQKSPINIREFCALIIHLANRIRNGSKMYIHCKAGHGRSGVLVSAILCYLYKITPEQSFQLTSKYHATRSVHARRPKMNEYWKSVGSPQTDEQRLFVKSLFQVYTVTPESPFNIENSWLNCMYHTFLMDTNLGPITGPNGYALQDYRDKLIENIVWF